MGLPLGSIGWQGEAHKVGHAFKTSNTDSASLEKQKKDLKNQEPNMSERVRFLLRFYTCPSMAERRREEWAGGAEREG